MFKAEHMGLSPSKESGQQGNHSSHKQSMSEQMHEFVIENVHSETLAQTHRLGSEGVQIVPGEISAAVSRPVLHENWQSSSKDVARNSITEHLGPPYEDTNKYGHTSKSSCPHQTVSGKMLEFGSECECTGPSKLKQQLGFVQNEPGESTTAVCGLVNENLQPFSKGVTNSSFAEHVEPPSQNVSKSSPTKKVPCPRVNALEQTVEFGPQSVTGEHGVENANNGSSEPKHRLDSEISQNEPGGLRAAVSSCFVDENFQPLSDDATKNSLGEHLRPPSEDVSKTSQTSKGSCPKQTISEQTLELGLEGVGCKQSEVKHKFCSELLENEPRETSTVVSSCIAIEQLGSTPELANRSSLAEPIALYSEVVLNIPSTGQSPPEDMAKNSRLEQLETLAKKPVKNSECLGRKNNKTSKLSKKKYTLRSSIGNDRVLRSRSQEKPKELESSNNLAEVSTGPSGGEKKRKKKKRTRMKQKGDEYSRIRKHLRYLLNRINYEQSLISAYSAEGWKGLSLEKLKPEKELQRATSEIFRRKLKIRDLFQHLDSLCAQGGLPESLFDSEGEISSEDIFCAKCGSKDLPADNDIILCDGACDRGFHQCCLEPPLLKEDIPPDDEGWLCPGCDCKVDCIDLLNDSQGTNLSINDNWEKVFPEAAAEAAAGHNQDPNFGLPSDDSDDDDYDPDGPETNQKDKQDESSSDESDFTSASDELEAPPNNDQLIGLPSDDSEDEDYNPIAPDLDEKVEQESSNSDFTSDSEDLGAALEENGSSLKDAVPISVSLPGDSIGRRSKLCGIKKQSIKAELSSLLESDPCQDGLAAASVKRIIERLDYKKLYDETYGNVSSSSGDDEDWNDAASPRQKRKGGVAPVSTNGNAIVVENGRSTNVLKQKTKESEHTPRRRTRQTAKFEDENTPSVKSHEGSSESGSCGKRTMSSAYRRLGESVTQRLYKSFKENQYPDRSTKESLARELEITFRQVNKWFENARWSFNHSSSMDASTAKTVSKDNPSPQSNKKPKTVSKGNPSTQSDKKLLELGPKTTTRGSTCTEAQNKESPKATAAVTECCIRDARDTVSMTQKSSREKSTPPKSRKRKRKGKLDEHASDPELRIEDRQKLLSDSRKPQEMQTGGRIQTRSRKLIS